MQTCVLVSALLLGQVTGRPATPPAATTAPAAVTTPLPSDYVIGPDDVLEIVFWKDKDLSTDVTVRPDGMITLPLLPELKAAGLTPDQLRDLVLKEARRYVESPTASVVVKQINSRKVFITGQVEKPAAYPITAPMTVMQLIATAGGLKEFAKAKEILVMRMTPQGPVAIRFNYVDVIKHNRFDQNIQLHPGDTVVVP
jgi:polysaccharide export outer membrane protein